jgi:hypothetical protein
MNQDWDVSLHVIDKYTLGPLGNTISYTTCKNMTNELVIGDTIYELCKVYSLGNDIELGMVATIRSWASKILRDKTNGI